MMIAEPFGVPMSFCGKTVPEAETAVRLILSFGPLIPIQNPAVSIALISAFNRSFASFSSTNPTLHDCARKLYPLTLIFFLLI